MTHDEIIEMARQADIRDSLEYDHMECDIESLEAFAKLVAQHEREIWERRCERLQSLMDIRETQPNKPCCLSEREACAKVAENMGPCGFTGESSANAIRAGGQA